MGIKVVRAEAVFTPLHILYDASLIIENDIVKRLVTSSINYDIDLRGYYVAPSFIDTHTHGCCGIDITNVEDTRQILKLTNSLPRFGVTAFIPTLVSAKHERILKTLSILREAINNNNGAKILGFALEGPYINPRRKGAQDPNAIRPPNIDEFHQYLQESNNLLKLIHMAPEMEGGFDLIQEAVGNGVYVSIGHTDADFNTVMKAIALGANRATHLYDAMSGIHHREAGAAFALLYSEDVYLELITDFIHVRPEIIKFTINYAGPQRIILVTDSIAAAGLGDGEYKLGELRVIVKNGKATLPDGTIAGSILTIDRAVRNIVSLGYEPRIAISMATQNPAKSLNINNMGCLRPGCKADFVVLSKDNYEVYETYINGDKVFSKLK
jgi:N-acetylglucosamine-6-phosphate deacetylase